jgi:hypothetical protein
MHDPEFDDIVNKLKNLKIKNQNEDFLPINTSQSNTKIDANFLLNLNKQNINDKNITLGEYLVQFKTLDKEIEEQRTTREEINDSDLSKLVDFINSEDEMKRIHIKPNKDLEDLIDSKYYTNPNTKFISKVSPGVFSSLKNAVRQSSTKRFETFSNTEAKLIKDDIVAPLNLVQYITKNN